MPPSNSSCTIRNSERNKHRPRIVAAASKRGTRTRVRIISDDGHYASTRTVCVVRAVPTADSRTERLRILLTASSNCHRLTRTYCIQLSSMSPGFPNKETPPSNSSCPQIVAAQIEQRKKIVAASDQRNTVTKFQIMYS